MRWIDIIGISLRMLRTNFLRSMLTVLGIGVAISFIVILIGLGFGLQNITIGSIVASKSLLSLDIQNNNQEGILLSEKTVKEMEALPEAAAVSPVVVTTGQIRIDGKLAAASVTAGTRDYLDMEGIVVKEGKGYTNEGNEIVVTPETLILIDIDPKSALGKVVELSYTDPNNENQIKQVADLTIVGLTEAGGVPAIYIPHKLMAKDGEVKLTLVKVVAKDREGVVKIGDAANGKGYGVDSLIETLDQAQIIFRWFTIGLGVFGTIALLVASIGMFNTLTIALIERTREIGIMKAIGVDNVTVKRLFLSEAAMIGFLGGISGITIGLLIDLIVSFTFNQAANVFEGTKGDIFQYPPSFLIIMLVFPTLLAVLTGLYPSIRASRLNPLRALRYE